jgi:hypothetical protein
MMNIDTKTYLAVGELVQSAAHQLGVTGPVEFTVCSKRNYEWCGLDDDYVEVINDEYEPPPTVDMLSMDELDQAEEFFYAP